MSTDPSSPDEVNTEAQRQALDAMSADLLRKFNTMVKEQEQRAQEFSVLQHSVSHLPQTPSPVTPEPYRPAAQKPAPDAATPLPPIPDAAQRKQRRQSPPAPSPAPKPPPAPHQPASATPHKSPDPVKVNEIFGKTFFIMIVVIFLLLRACSD